MDPRLLGRSGELLVCLDFMALGHWASLETYPNAPYDVLADVYGKLLKIQVKTTARPVLSPNRGTRFPRYVFNWHEENYSDIDIFAFVAFDIKKIVYRNAKNVRGSFRRSINTFGNGKDSLLECLRLRDGF